MVALKANEVDAFLAKPNPARSVVLIYGPDAGLVRERGQALINASVDDPTDPFKLSHLAGDELASEPSRLAEEAHTAPLFGGKRAVSVKAGSRNFAPAVEALLASPPADCRVVIEAGDLRRTAPLRTLCEKSKSAVTIPCYIDGERELSRVIDDELGAARLSIAPEARAALASLIGGDRLASRSEIRKLALYAQGQSKVELDDVLAVVADASALALDAIVDAAFAGRIGEMETQLSKMLTAGTPAGTIISAALRHIMQLHKARLALDEGQSIDQVVWSFVPPLPPRRKSPVEAALKAWTAPRLTKAMEQLADAALDVRRTPALSEALAQRALLSVTQSARRTG
jgi:DNA polymerase-3 subunit delta